MDFCILLDQIRNYDSINLFRKELSCIRTELTQPRMNLIKTKGVSVLIVDLTHYVNMIII